MALKQKTELDSLIELRDSQDHFKLSSESKQLIKDHDFKTKQSNEILKTFEKAKGMERNEEFKDMLA